MKKLSLLQMTCLGLLLCAGTATTLPAQTLTTLHSFNGSDGEEPYAGPIIQATDGNFYGTTFGGGAHYDGTVFKITPTGTVTVLYGFLGYDGNPTAGLIQAIDGNFYGTTSGVFDNGYGTVFKITPSGTLSTLYYLCSQNNCADGRYPSAGLIQASDDNFYGTTYEGGASDNCDYGCGTVFKITPSGTLTTLYSFCAQANCADGANPYAGLVQATDGNFYGTTSEGGAYFSGTVFRITPSGTLSTLYSFCSANCADGANPFAALIQATDGNFYGTTAYGGARYDGTVFKITPTGTLTTLHSFNGSDGAYPDAGLIQATDGNFYGTTAGNNEGGNCYYGCGTVFKITPRGTLTTLHTFGSARADGAVPYAGLIQARDGNLYGTTSEGGVYGDGTVFRLVLPRPCIVCSAAE